MFIENSRTMAKNNFLVIDMERVWHYIKRPIKTKKSGVEYQVNPLPMALTSHVLSGSFPNYSMQILVNGLGSSGVWHKSLRSCTHMGNPGKA